MAIKKSNRGAPIDMDALIAANKSTPAVGNMNVNASEDLIGPGGEVIQRNEERVRAYYRDNPASSTSQASLKGDMPKLTPDPDTKPAYEPKTAKTAAENVRTQEQPPVSETIEEVLKDKQVADTEVEPIEPDEFAAPQPLGYKEVEQPNGDFEMVPYYDEEDAPDEKPSNNNSK